MRDIAPDAGTMDALLHGRLGDPFSVLGPHRGPKGTVIRTFQPGAEAVEIAAGRMTPREAVDKLVDEIAGSDQLGASERAELRELLADLVANDPYLQSIVGRL